MTFITGKESEHRKKFELNVQTLADVKHAADSQSKVQGLSSRWVRAYERLADAADHLEAMYRRLEVGE